MTISITKEFEFHAAHHLPDHPGKCKDVHGHSYRLQIQISGPIKDKGPETGMVMDFGTLKAVVNEHVVEKLDHKDLNLIWRNPTAENMVGDIAGWLEVILKTLEVKLEFVRLWETNTSYAEWGSE